MTADKWFETISYKKDTDQSDMATDTFRTYCDEDGTVIRISNEFVDAYDSFCDCKVGFNELELFGVFLTLKEMGVFTGNIELNKEYNND